MSAAPRERPILFSGPMVRAIQKGRKTETRRILRGEPPACPDHGTDCPDLAFERCCWADLGEVWTDGWTGYRSCPYGQPGDLLWVRERVTRSGGYAQYLADGKTSRHLWPAHWKRDPQAARFMPKRFARLWLRVLDGRIERLQDITEEAAIAEGVAPFFERFQEAGAEQRLTTGELAVDSQFRAGFAVEWDEINGDRATWKDNPWVWVVRFEVARGGARD